MAGDFFGKIFSSIKSFFTEDETEDILEPSEKETGGHDFHAPDIVQKEKPRILLLPKVVEEDIILVRRPGDSKVEILLAHLIPAICAYLLINSGEGKESGIQGIRNFADENCFYFKTPKSKSGRKWEEVCLECYERVFSLLPYQQQRIDDLTTGILKDIGNREEVAAFLFECVIFTLDTSNPKLVAHAETFFSDQGLDSKTLSAVKKRVKKAKKKKKAD